MRILTSHISRLFSSPRDAANIVPIELPRSLAGFIFARASCVNCGAGRKPAPASIDAGGGVPNCSGKLALSFPTIATALAILPSSSNCSSPFIASNNSSGERRSRRRKLARYLPVSLLDAKRRLELFVLSRRVTPSGVMSWMSAASGVPGGVSVVCCVFGFIVDLCYR